MGRKNAHSHAMRDSGLVSSTLSLGASFNTEPSNILFTDNVSIIATWTGTSPVGVLTVQVSNDSSAAPTKWETLTLDGTASVSGNSDNGTINLNQLSYAWLRLVYTRGSGVGSMTIDLTSKQLGG